jgi:hypothetical protein
VFSLNLLRAVATSSSAHLARAKNKPIRFKGQLIDEVHPADRKKMDIIDKFTRTELLSQEQRHAHEEYLSQYHDLNDELRHGVTKNAIIGLMSKRIEKMWNQVPGKYKQLFEQFQQPQQSEPSPKLRRYSSSRSSHTLSSIPDTIAEESE